MGADAHVDRFLARLQARMVQGRIEYGDRSFRRPACDLIDEVQQELEDVSGWSAILWSRLEHIKERLRAAKTDEGDES